MYSPESEDNSDLKHPLGPQIIAYAAQAIICDSELEKNETDAGGGDVNPIARLRMYRFTPVTLLTRLEMAL
ncbi:hypothetical protein NECAME_08341 [Necator americanus]|uniref:Uncharacterized protein n=1 Tax=Necator americanus TaxID=51031 RepID=W2THW9_NECAM|nr:hypothetical protein NECAME_08341 [Necator americanus]ETN81675.1 hypothetical protein NECAME_08341 [Necator americanus]